MKRIMDHFFMMILVISLVINTIFINITPPIFKQLVFVGFILLGFGIFLLILALVTLRKKGTDRIIDTGIYGIVRHPIYLAGMIMFFSHIFLGQHWIVVVSTGIAIGCCYVAMRSGDRRNLEKFGDDYAQYMKKVPRMNFVAGLTRLTKKARQQNTL
jgi:protein-S-isoprenylcysteine O-methyltransferase Ste14